MAESSIKALIQDPLFLRLDPPAQVEALKKAGLEEGKAQSLAQDLARATGSPSIMVPPPSLESRILGVAGRAAPSVVGGLVGGAVSPALGVPSPVGSAVGSMLGETGRQLFTEKQMDWPGIAASGAIGRATGGLPSTLAAKIPGQTMMQLARRVPGAQGALQDIGQAAVEEVPVQLMARTKTLLSGLGVSSVGELFDRALKKSNPSIGLEATKAAADELTDVGKDLAKLGVPRGKLGTIAANLLKVGVEAGDETAPLRFMDRVRRELGDIIQSSEVAGKRELAGRARHLLAGVYDDIDVAAQFGIPGAAELQAGTRLARREFAAEDFSKLLQRSTGRAQQVTGFQPLRFNQILTELKAVKAGNPPRALRLFAGSLEPGELDSMIKTVELWNSRIGAIPAAPGQPVGSSKSLGAMAAGYFLGPMLGIPREVAGAGALFGSNALSRLLMSPRGRATLREAIESGVPIDLGRITANFLGQSAMQSLKEPGGTLMERFQAPRLENP